MLGFHGGKYRVAAFSGRSELYLVRETALHAPKTADQKVPLVWYLVIHQSTKRWLVRFLHPQKKRRRNGAVGCDTVMPNGNVHFHCWERIRPSLGAGLETKRIGSWRAGEGFTRDMEHKLCLRVKGSRWVKRHEQRPRGGGPANAENGPRWHSISHSEGETENIWAE